MGKPPDARGNQRGLCSRAPRRIDHKRNRARPARAECTLENGGKRSIRQARSPKRADCTLQTDQIDPRPTTAKNAWQRKEAAHSQASRAPRRSPQGQQQKVTSSAVPWPVGGKASFARDALRRSMGLAHLAGARIFAQSSFGENPPKRAIGCLVQRARSAKRYPSPRASANSESTAMRTATPISTWSWITERVRSSAIAPSISTPRFMGPGCMTMASALA